MKALNKFGSWVKELAARISLKKHLPWCIGLALLVLILLGKYLFTGELLLSKIGTDAYLYFYHTQSFLHDEVMQGNIPLWNPYVYSGHPFLGDFQSAMLYPLTWVLVVLPPALAINWWFALHLIIFGIAMYAWLSYRGCTQFAAFVGGAAAMFAGTHFIHIYAGHMPAISSGAWAPLIFLGIDGWLRRRHGGWLVLSAFAVAVQLYAGHPQYVYYTSIGAGLYSALMLFRKNAFSWTKAFGLLAIYPAGMILALAQILPGISTMQESVRSGGLPFESASIFALPPENILTLLAPWIFGGTDEVAYWGRNYIWEMQLFLGIGVTMLAAWGLAGQAKGIRWRTAALLAMVLILAMGVYTPVYGILYKWLPFFSSFRGTSKFIFLLGLFGAVLAGHGMDRLLRGELPGLKVSVAIAGAGVFVALAGVLLYSGGAAGSWHGFILKIAQMPESYFQRPLLDAKTGFLQLATKLSGKDIMISGLWILAFGALLALGLRRRLSIWAFGALSVLNLCIFAAQSITSFNPKDMLMKPLVEYLDANKDDFRTLNLVNPSVNMTWRREGIWGYDPLILRRYAEFMYYSQGIDPNIASQQSPFRQASPMLNMFRCKTAFVPAANGVSISDKMGEPLRRFAFVTDYKIIKNRDDILREVAAPTFNATKTVILEETPIPEPEKDNVTYTLRLLQANTDEWVLEAVCDKACILLMTDAYSKDWRAETLPDSVQTNYNVMAANYAMRAVPLAAGRHVFRLVYTPSGLGAGMKISLVLAFLLVLALCLPFARRRLDFKPKDASAS